LFSAVYLLLIWIFVYSFLRWVYRRINSRNNQ
jgi:hypothetical protein